MMEHEHADVRVDVFWSYSVVLVLSLQLPIEHRGGQECLPLAQLALTQLDCVDAACPCLFLCAKIFGTLTWTQPTKSPP